MQGSWQDLWGLLIGHLGILSAGLPREPSTSFLFRICREHPLQDHFMPPTVRRGFTSCSPRAPRRGAAIKPTQSQRRVQYRCSKFAPCAGYRLLRRVHQSTGFGIHTATQRERTLERLQTRLSTLCHSRQANEHLTRGTCAAEKRPLLLP